MFAKIINNTVESYPYSPQSDYPLTSFPVGASYPDFNCYWVHPTPQTPPVNHTAIEGQPIYNPELNRWEQAWEYQEIVPPVVPNWDGFNATMLADVVFNQTMGAVMQSAPAVAVAIPAALSQVAANGVTAFALVFNAFCQVGQVTTQQRGDWADIAESFNLPADFVELVRGA